MRDTTVKVHIYADDFTQAAELAATMNLHWRQWEWMGSDEWLTGTTWADVQPLFDRIQELEENT